MNSVSAVVCAGGDSVASSSFDSVLPGWPGAPGWTTRLSSRSSGASPVIWKAAKTPRPRPTTATTAAMMRRRGENMTPRTVSELDPSGERVAQHLDRR
jgi:hypothetical protein